MLVIASIRLKIKVPISRPITRIINGSNSDVKRRMALRVAILAAIALVIFAVLFLRLWSLQILAGSKYEQAALDNQIRTFSIEAQRGVFSRFYVNMIRAGEAGGSLPTVLLRLAEYMERAKALRDNVTASLIYPAILAGVSLAAVVFLLGVVVPRFKPIFAGTGKATPFITQMVLLAGDVLRGYWFAFVALGVSGKLGMSTRRP